MSSVRFNLPDQLVAHEPPEVRGIGRDRVRLLVTDRHSEGVEHSRFDRIATHLRAGDLLVLNASRTLPASLRGTTSAGTGIEARLAEHAPNGTWLALLLCDGGDPIGCGISRGMTIDFGAGLIGTVVDRDVCVPRLWRLQLSESGERLVELLYRIGSPVRYEYVSQPWPLEAYQTVFASAPGSAEMPSAGRAFTWRLLLELRRRGISTTSIVLHTGLSSYMDDRIDSLHLASEEEYAVSETAARAVNETRRRGGRVIAVGTTVVRALETAARGGVVEPGRAYTRLRVTASHRLRAVDGLVTGMHEPEASHLDLLTAFLPERVIESSYAEAVERGYLWHEFGDLNLIV